jgi:uncharacterized protein (TIGR02453 family)
MAKTFPGFSTKMPAFFRGLARNNTREWFTPRKAVFEEHVRGPMVELLGLVNEDLKRFAVDYSVAAPAKTIYRIYRDTRFSKDKTPYKTHIGATFPRQGLSKHGGGGFYFGVSHEHVEVAGGLYLPPPEELAAVRGAIARDAKELVKLIKAIERTRRVGKLRGECLKRLPKGFESATGEAGELVKHKQLYFYETLGPEVALSPRVRREIVSRFELLVEFVEWINRAILAARAQGEEEGRPVRPAPMR